MQGRLSLNRAKAVIEICDYHQLLCGVVLPLGALASNAGLAVADLGASALRRAGSKIGV